MYLLFSVFNLATAAATIFHPAFIIHNKNTNEDISNGHIGPRSTIYNINVT